MFYRQKLKNIKMFDDEIYRESIKHIKKNLKVYIL